MTDKDRIRELISSFEGTEKLLFSDPSNPYESIYISAYVYQGCLTVKDSECEHAPDGGWTHILVSFDRENTEKAFAYLSVIDPDPFRALARLVDYHNRTELFKEGCTKRGIQYETRFSF